MTHTSHVISFHGLCNTQCMSKTTRERTIVRTNIATVENSRNNVNKHNNNGNLNAVTVTSTNMVIIW